MSIDKPSKIVFIDEEKINEELAAMELDESLDTSPVYTVHSPYPDQKVPFLIKHKTYLKTHPKINPEYYLANLRTMIKIRN